MDVPIGSTPKQKKFILSILKQVNGIKQIKNYITLIQMKLKK